MAVPTASTTLCGSNHMVAGLTTDIDSAARNPLGTRAFDNAGNEYIYLQGVASVAVGSWVVYNGAFLSVLPTANTAYSGPMAVACAATVANKFGWFQIFGLTPATTAIATDAAADGKSVSNGASGANGRLLTGPTTTKNVFGAVASGAAASNAGAAFLTYPFMFGTATI